MTQHRLAAWYCAVSVKRLGAIRSTLFGTPFKHISTYWLTHDGHASHAVMRRPSVPPLQATGHPALGYSQ